MTFARWPQSAAWLLHGAHDGFEVCFFSERPDATLLSGHTAAVEDGVAWAVRYEIAIDAAWRTRRVVMWSSSSIDERSIVLEADGTGHWSVDGAEYPAVEGCIDIDLEASACTNTLPVHRFALAPGETSDAPAAYVRRDLRVERLEQRYRRVPDDPAHGQQFDYESPAFDFRATLTYDASGLIVDYPGIARRLR
jgi:hypothetical protein